MTTRATWASYDQSRLLTGNGLTGVGVEIDHRMEMLRAEADTRRSAPHHGLRQRIGHRLVHLGASIEGIEVTVRPRQEQGSRTRPA